MVRLKPLYAKHQGEPAPLFFNRRQPPRTTAQLASTHCFPKWVAWYAVNVEAIGCMSGRFSGVPRGCTVFEGSIQIIPLSNMT